MIKTQAIGRLTADPTLKYIPNGTAVANFNIAVDRTFSKEKKADFFPVVVWGKQAESVATYVSKGKLIGVAGRMENREWTDKTGNKRTVTEIIAEEVQFIEWADKPSEPKTDEFSDLTPIDEDSIPF